MPKTKKLNSSPADIPLLRPTEKLNSDSVIWSTQVKVKMLKK